LIHRNFPLDRHCNPTVKRAFHERACYYARLAICAGEAEKFWEANDYLFAHGRRSDPVTEDELVARVGLDADRLRNCMRGTEASRKIEDDLRDGIGWRVRGTPTFVVGGRSYPGRIPPEVIAELLDDGSSP
jgi:protein-disulfide isomerase